MVCAKWTRLKIVSNFNNDLYSFLQRLICDYTIKEHGRRRVEAQADMKVEENKSVGCLRTRLVLADCKNISLMITKALRRATDKWKKLKRKPLKVYREL